MSYSDRRVEAVLEILSSSYSSRVSLAALAAHIGLSSSALQHLFKKHVHRSIRSYVKEKRLTAAAELLAASDERVSQIGYAVGFSDMANFTHAFRARFGVSPRDYRWKIRCASGSYQEIAGQTKTI